MNRTKPIYENPLVRVEVSQQSTASPEVKLGKTTSMVFRTLVATMSLTSQINGTKTDAL